ETFDSTCPLNSSEVARRVNEGASSGFPLLSLCFDESLNARVLWGTFLTTYLRRKQWAKTPKQVNKGCLCCGFEFLGLSSNSNHRKKAGSMVPSLVFAEPNSLWHGRL
ncbi:hypothetical protein HAX54_000989, partial [Datura stramonium]|nr:hypothetical protein [Datura stramonium]